MHSSQTDSVGLGFLHTKIMEIYTPKARLKTRAPSETEYELMNYIKKTKTSNNIRYIIIFGTILCIVPSLCVAFMYGCTIASLLPVALLLVIYAVCFCVYIKEKHTVKKEFSKENIRVVKAICTNKRRVKNPPRKEMSDKDMTRYTFFTEYNDIYQVINPVMPDNVSKDDNCIIVWTNTSDIYVLKTETEKRDEAI